MSRGFDPNAVNEGLTVHIKNYCKSRNYKCKGCRYSGRWIVEHEGQEYHQSLECIFGNLPCDWDVAEA